MGRVILICVLFFLSNISLVSAEENKGFNLSNIFKMNKASEVEAYEPIEEKKDPALKLTGRSGPTMPAVPAGEIKKEVIVQTPTPSKKNTFLKISKAITKPLPPVTLKYDPKIPYLSIVFQNGFQKNLEPSHKNILSNSVKNMRQGNYRGAIRIQSFSDRGHQTAMERAQQIRTYMINNNIFHARY